MSRGARQRRGGFMAKAPVEGGTKKGQGFPPAPEGHPYDFHVSGPRNLSSLTWRELLRSSWSDQSYRRIAFSCFVQAAYLLELDRQEKRTEDSCLAPKWWKPFKYKLVQTLIDERDGSIYGAILEWNRAAALYDLILMRPSGAPKAVLALRGTLLKGSTVRRDLEDDLRFVAWESLKGSVRFNGALEALKSAVERHGTDNVCIAGHSLGAGFALQVGKALAKQGLFVECHLFNPPSVSLSMGVRIIREKASALWKKYRPGRPLVDEVKDDRTLGEEMLAEAKRWVPNLYINNGDYVCCYYVDRSGVAAVSSDGMKKDDGNRGASAKMFVVSKVPKKFLEAHGLQQWWSDDAELELAVQESKLIYRQLKSLYATSPLAVPMNS